MTAQPHDKLLTRDDERHLELFRLIWLDTEVNVQEKRETQEKLRTIINYVKKFHNVDECKNYIEQTPEDDRLVLIVDGQSGRQIVPSIHQLRQVSAIYLHSKDKESEEKWVCEFAKVRFFQQASVVFHHNFS